MADTYSSNAHFVLMATGRTGWGSVLNATLGQLDAFAAIGGGNVVPLETPDSASLQVAVRPCTFRKSSTGGEVSTLGGTLACTANVMNYVYLDNSGVPQVATGGFPAGEIVKLATVLAGASTIASITDQRRVLETGGVAPAAVFVGSGPGHTTGLVPDPGASAGTSRFLREDATFAAIPAFVASGASHAAGLVPDPGATAGTSRFLRENATWATPPTFVASGASAAAGYVPSPGTTAGTRRVLLENATWGTPPVFIASGATAAVGSVPAPPATAGTTRFLREDATWVVITTMVASGASAAGGLVPTPPGTAGSVLFLREDATWAAPRGAVIASVSQTNVASTFTDITLFANGSSRGLYEVSTYVTVGVVGTSGNVQVNLKWTDDNGILNNETAVSLPVTALGYAKATSLIQCLSTQNVTFSVSFTGTPGPLVYSVYFAVRKLI